MWIWMERKMWMKMGKETWIEDELSVLKKRKVRNPISYPISQKLSSAASFLYSPHSHVDDLVFAPSSEVEDSWK